MLDLPLADLKEARFRYPLFGHAISKNPGTYYDMLMPSTNSISRPAFISPSPLSHAARLAAIALFTLSYTALGHGVTINYDVAQAFVAGEGDYEAYLGVGVDPSDAGASGTLTLELPPAGSTADATEQFSDTSTTNPLTLSLNGLDFTFGGPTTVDVDVAAEWILLRVDGADGWLTMSFHPLSGEPAFDPNPLDNLSLLDQWGGYFDFYHSNGSRLYSDWGQNVHSIAVVGDGSERVPETGATAAMLVVACGALAARRGLKGRLLGAARQIAEL